MCLLPNFGGKKHALFNFDFAKNFDRCNFWHLHKVVVSLTKITNLANHAGIGSVLFLTLTLDPCDLDLLYTVYGGMRVSILKNQHKILCPNWGNNENGLKSYKS